MNDILILTFNGPEKDSSQKVYRHTLCYVREHLPQAEVLPFTNNQALLTFVKAHHFSTVIATNEMPSEVSLLLKGLGLVMVIFGYDEELAKVADIVIDPLLPKSEKYLVGPRFLLSSVFDAVPLAEVASLLNIPGDVLKEEVACNQADEELLSICRLYQKMEWDSSFFGMNVGYISCLRLTPNIEKHISKFLRREKIDLVEYLCNCHDRESVLVSERSGYSFVDIRLTFERLLSGPATMPLRPGFTVRKARAGDVPELKRIGTDIYKHSRYYFDANFDRAKVVEFYQGWIAKAVDGQFDDFAYILAENDCPVGFCTVKKFGRRSARFNLVGIDAGRAKEGLAKVLIDSALGQLYNDGITHVEVVTQGRNYAAQRLYQRCGFVTKTTELWYHKWFR